MHILSLCIPSLSLLQAEQDADVAGMVGDRQVVRDVRLEDIEETTEIASHQRNGSTAYGDVGAEAARESAIAVPLQDTHRTVDALGIAGGGEIKVAVAVKIGDGDPLRVGTHAQRRIAAGSEVAVAIPQQHGYCVVEGVSHCQVQRPMMMKVTEGSQVRAPPP